MSAHKDTGRAAELRALRATPLQRKTPLGRKPKAKGNRGELAVIKLFIKFGWENARRNWQSGGQGGGDVINGPPGCNHEVKNREALNIWAALEQSENACRPSEQAVVWFKRNRSKWYAAVDAEFLLYLLRFLEDHT